MIQQPDKQKKRKVFLWIALVVLFLLFFKVIGWGTFLFFLFIDNLFRFHSSIPPALVWAFFGLLLFAIPGAYFARRRYRLNFWILPLSAVPAAAFLLLAILINKPSQRLIDGFMVAYQDSRASNFIRTEASSHLPAYKNTTYLPGNIDDFDRNTAWIGEHGVGDTLWFVFSGLPDRYEDVVFRRLKMLNGYAKDSRLWRQHNRVAGFTLVYDGKEIGSFDVPDAAEEWQEFEIDHPIPIKRGDRLGLAVTALHRGTGRNTYVAISELDVLIDYRQFSMEVPPPN